MVLAPLQGVFFFWRWSFAFNINFGRVSVVVEYNSCLQGRDAGLRYAFRAGDRREDCTFIP